MTSLLSAVVLPEFLLRSSVAKEELAVKDQDISAALASNPYRERIVFDKNLFSIYDTVQIFDMWTPRNHEPRLGTDCAHQRCYIYTRYGSGCSHSVVEVYIHHERQQY